MQLPAILIVVMKHMPFPDRAAFLRIKPALLSVLYIITCRMPGEGRLLQSGNDALKNAVQLCGLHEKAFNARGGIRMPRVSPERGAPGLLRGYGTYLL